MIDGEINAEQARENVKKHKTLTRIKDNEIITSICKLIEASSKEGRSFQDYDGELSSYILESFEELGFKIAARSTGVFKNQYRITW